MSSEKPSKSSKRNSGDSVPAVAFQTNLIKSTESGGAKESQMTHNLLLDEENVDKYDNNKMTASQY